MAKVEANIDNLEKLIKSLKTTHRVKVGIIGAQAKAVHSGSDGLTNAQLGTIHELGAHINHPGGQPYYIDQKSNKAVFVPKDIPFSENLPRTKPHTIDIPARSFLYKPIMDNLAKDTTNWKKEAWKDFFVKFKPVEFFEMIKERAVLIAIGAFDDNGYNQWKELTAGTKRQKAAMGYSSKALITTGRGGLRSTISGKVYKR